MSRRYGRNQKRRHREQIDALIKEVCNTSRMAASHYKEAAEAENKYKDLAARVNSMCNFSACVDPREVDFNHRHDDVIRVPTYVPMTWDVASEKTAIAKDIYSSYVNVHKLRVVMKDHQESFAKAIHMYMGRDGHSAYYLSMRALIHAPQEAIRRIAEDIAVELIRCMSTYVRGHE